MDILVLISVLLAMLPMSKKGTLKFKKRVVLPFFCLSFAYLPFLVFLLKMHYKPYITVAIDFINMGAIGF